MKTAGPGLCKVGIVGKRQLPFFRWLALFLATFFGEAKKVDDRSLWFFLFVVEKERTIKVKEKKVR